MHQEYEEYEEIIEVSEKQDAINSIIEGTWTILPLIIILYFIIYIINALMHLTTHTKILIIFTIWSFLGYLFPNAHLHIRNVINTIFINNKNEIDINKININDCEILKNNEYKIDLYYDKLCYDKEFVKISKIGFELITIGSAIILISQIFDILGVYFGICLIFIGAFFIILCPSLNIKEMCESFEQHPTKSKIFIANYQYIKLIHESSKLKYIENISANKLILISGMVAAILTSIFHIIT